MILGDYLQYVSCVVSDDQISLYSAGVSNGSDLFVWNGREVGTYFISGHMDLL